MTSFRSPVIFRLLDWCKIQVLEALNRLLDHNRELYLSETQETIKPHPHFRLFATQNPPGVYGGRKPLSRAFRNRFMEVSCAAMFGSSVSRLGSCGSFRRGVVHGFTKDTVCCGRSLWFFPAKRLLPIDGSCGLECRN